MKVLNQERIAARLNISRSTISRALANDPRISPATRTLVQKTARELGYARTLRARNRRDGIPQALTIGIVAQVPTNRDGFVLQSHFLTGIRQQAESEHMKLDVYWDESGATSREFAHDSLWRQARGNDWRGMVLINPGTRQGFEKILHRMPAVSLAYDQMPAMADTVCLNRIEAIRSLGRSLFRAGHQRIGFLMPPGSRYDEVARGTSRHAEALEGMQLMERWILRSPAPGQGKGADPFDFLQVQNLMLKEGVRAWICERAADACRLFEMLGTGKGQVPGGCAIATLEGDRPHPLPPEIISLQTPAEEMGSIALNYLHTRIRNPDNPPCCILVTPRVKPSVSDATTVI